MATLKTANEKYEEVFKQALNEALFYNRQLT
jgi:hypothetical protein